MAIHGGFCARDIVYFAYKLKEIPACLVSYLYAKYTISWAQNSPWIAIKALVIDLYERPAERMQLVIFAWNSFQRIWKVEAHLYPTISSLSIGWSNELIVWQKS